MKMINYVKSLFTRGEKTTLQKQARAGIIILCLALIGTVVYFAAIAPALDEKTNYVPKLYDGEYFSNNTISILEQRTRDKVTSIEVKNSHDHYKIVAKDPGSAYTDFYIVGEEDMSLNATNLASLVTHTLTLVTNSPNYGVQDRVNEYATDSDLAAYGLDEASDPSYFIVSLTDGTSYKIVVGDMSPTSDGYYCMLEGRYNIVENEQTGAKEEYHIIYSLTTYVSSDILGNSSAALINTVAGPYLANDTYEPSNFMLERRSQNGGYYTVVKLHTYVDTDPTSVGNQTYALDVPYGYIVNEETLTNAVLYYFEYLSAQEVLAYGNNVFNPEVYEKYGLDLDPERLSLGTEDCYARVTLEVPGEDGNETYMFYFGDVYYDESGTGYRYVYSPYSKTIFTVLDSEFSFVSWISVRFISASMFYDYITSLDYLELVDDETDIRYALSGNYMNYHVDVTKASDPTVKIIRDGEPLTFDVITQKVSTGSYTQTKFMGEFENFRKLFYVLITREYALDVDNVAGDIAETPSRTITIKTTERDQNASYYRYDVYGNRLVENGKYVTAIYNGGYVKCTNVVLKTTGLSGEEKTFTYDVAYYDESNGKFFLKEEDRADSNLKPKNYKIDEDGHISSWTYLNGSVSAEYTEKKCSYNIYDIIYESQNADGSVSKRANQTYSYVVPTVTEYRYRINEDGTHELISEKTEVSDGLYMRTAQIDKLFSDSDKLYNKIEIDKFGAN